MSRGMKGESVVAQGARRVTEVISDSARALCANLGETLRPLKLV